MYPTLYRELPDGTNVPDEEAMRDREDVLADWAYDDRDDAEAA